MTTALQYTDIRDGRPAAVILLNLGEKTFYSIILLLRSTGSTVNMK